MSATNSTLNYQLPQFIATDKPAWLVDFNGAMSDIDTAIKEAKTAGDNAQTTANTNATNIQTLDGTVTSQGTAIGTLSDATTANTGSINTINSLIGNGQPTTTDKTIIGAINELHSDIQGLSDPDAEDVSFDNANTGLQATNVQAAIVEVKGLIPGAGSVDADDVSYDNTTSGLAATDVQGAIDEVDAKFGGSMIKYDSTSQKMQYSSDGGTTWVNFNGAFSVDEVESAEDNVNTTLSYTFVSDHDEILIDCNVNQFILGVVPSPTIAASSSDFTVTLFHDTSKLWGAGGYNAAVDRKTYHAENIKAGDTITFTATLTSTGSATAYSHVMDYTIFSIN